MLWTLWSKWMFCWLWKGEIGLAANHFTFSCLLVPYSEEPFLRLFRFRRPRAVCHVNNDHFYSQTSQRTLGFFKNFFINWCVCLFIFIFTLKCHSKFNYRSTENKKVAKWFGNLKKPRGRITTWASLLKYVLLQELIYQWSRERSWKNDGKHWIKLQGRSQAFSKGLSSLCQAVLTSFPFT